MKWHHAVGGLMSTAAILMPLSAVPESQIQTAAPGKAVSASAHVNFKIVIPPVLYLSATGEQTVAVMSNSRNITLNATSAADTAGANGRPRSNLILNAAGRRVIARETRCAVAAVPVGTPTATVHPVICTASMP